MAGEGAILRKTREEKGLSYEDVENSIKIRVRYLQALENEEYDILPGTTYTKGFLRTYARYLGINPEEVIECYNASFQRKTEPEVHPPLTPISSTPVWFKPIVLLVMALFAVAVVIGITYISQTRESPLASDYIPAPLPTTPQTNNQDSLNLDKEKAGTTGQNADISNSNQVVPPVKYEGLVAELIFTEDCWLVVKADGKTVLEGMNAAGTTRTLQAKNRIEFVTIGNAGGLSLKLNGVQLPSLGRSKEVLHNYVLTEEILKQQVVQ